MKKKWIFLVLAVCLAAVAGIAVFHRPIEDQLPPMAVVEGRRYQLAEVLEGGPNSLPDGTLTEFIGNRLPQKDSQYNFDAEEPPYWKCAEGICVYVKENGNYLLFEEAEIQE